MVVRKGESRLSPGIIKAEEVVLHGLFLFGSAQLEKSFLIDNYGQFFLYCNYEAQRFFVLETTDFILPISIPPVRLVDENSRQSRAGEA